jgi:two-component system, OmpR family, phosphate regulon response regulator PhoB
VIIALVNSISINPLAASPARRLLKLGPIEYRILAHLMARQGRIVSREQLLENCWSTDTVEIDARTVDVRIGRLRKAIVQGDECDPIRTVRNEGYVFDVAD